MVRIERVFFRIWVKSMGCMFGVLWRGSFGVVEVLDAETEDTHTCVYSIHHSNYTYCQLNHTIARINSLEHTTSRPASAFSLQQCKIKPPRLQAMDRWHVDRCQGASKTATWPILPLEPPPTTDLPYGICSDPETS